MKLWAREVSCMVLSVVLLSSKLRSIMIYAYLQNSPFAPVPMQCQSTGLVLILETVLELAFFGEKFDRCTNCVSTHYSGLFLRDVGKKLSLWRDFILSHVAETSLEHPAGHFTFKKTLSFKLDMHRSDSINPCQPEKKVE